MSGADLCGTYRGEIGWVRACERGDMGGAHCNGRTERTNGPNHEGLESED